MRDKVLKTIEEFSMLKEGQTVVAGLSGGADSIVLTHILMNITSVHAVHINHGLRGEEANRDCEFVINFCKENNIPLTVFSFDLKEEAKKMKLGIEEAGRNIRYKVFSEAAERLIKQGRDVKIATAHTLSDCAETLLLNITRGCSLAGLCGIPPVRENIIRPLIRCSRNEIEQYARENNLQFATDSSNFSKEYNRNLIRLDVIPVLKSVNPSFLEAVGRLTDSARADTEYLNKIAEKSVTDDVQGLLKLDFSILSRVLNILCRDFSIEKKHIFEIYEILKRGYGAVSLPKNGVARVKDNIFSVKREDRKKKDEYWESEIIFQQTILPNGRKVYIEAILRQEYEERKKFSKSLFTKAINYDIITNNARLRGRKAGDVFLEAGRGCRKTIKKLFNEKKIPCDKRGDIILLEQNNEILWVEGIGASEKAKITEECKYILVIASEGEY